jgi:hypothetical protein
MRVPPGALALLVATGCFSGGPSGGSSSAPPPPGPPAVGALAVRPVAWNAANVGVGHVQAVAEVAEVAYVFSDAGITQMQSGAAVAADPSVTAWNAAGAIPSIDADGTTWAVGVGADGHVYRARAAGPAEDLSTELGLAMAQVRDLAASASVVGFELAKGLAVDDGKTLTSFEGEVDSVAVAGGRIAAVSPGAVRVLDASSLAESDVALDAVAFVAFDTDGTLLAATPSGLYVENGTALDLVWDAGGVPVHGLAASSDGVWVAAGAQLVLWHAGAIAVTSTSPIDAGARVVGSPSGGVWTITPAGALARFAVDDGSTDEALWQDTVQPVSARVCSNCHSAPGTQGKDSSGFDLSTYSAWKALRPLILTRVVTDAAMATAMPPPSSGYWLSPDEESAIGTWAAGH